MTTIAFKDGVMASDSYMVSSYIEQVEYKKIHEVNGLYIGCSGSVSDINRFLTFAQNGFRSVDIPENSEQAEFHALVFDPDAETIEDSISYYDCAYVKMAGGQPCAIGSGSDFAMGAMLAGSNAIEAVEVASKLDPYTGGIISAYKFHGLEESEEKIQEEKKEESMDVKD